MLLGAKKNFCWVKACKSMWGGILCCNPPIFGSSSFSTWLPTPHSGEKYNNNIFVSLFSYFLWRFYVISFRINCYWFFLMPIDVGNIFSVTSSMGDALCFNLLGKPFSFFIQFIFQYRNQLRIQICDKDQMCFRNIYAPESVLNSDTKQKKPYILTWYFIFKNAWKSFRWETRELRVPACLGLHRLGTLHHPRRLSCRYIFCGSQWC